MVRTSRGRLASAVARSLVILFAVALLMVCSFTARGEWVADVETAPSDAYQQVPFDYQVTVKNTGNTTLHITRINATIYWPWDGWMFPDSSPPSQSFEVFSGDRAIGVGENHTFTASVTTGFGGGFPTNTYVRAYTDANNTVFTKKITGGMTFAPAPPVEPTPVEVGFLSILLVPVLLGIFAFGFYWGKFYWSHEIESAMKEPEPDALLIWKWYPYYWERDGAMWKNYLLWAAISVGMALIVMSLSLAG